MIRQHLFNQKLLIKTAIILFTIANISACSERSQSIPKGKLIDVADISQDSNVPIRQSVLVRNDILERVGTEGFILDKDRVFNGSTVLVVNVSQTPLKLPNHDSVEVLVDGIVEKFDLTTVEQKYGLKLNPDTYSQYKDKPAIMASSVTLSPDPEDITNKPENYYGKYLAVKGEVEDVKSFGVFELDEEQAFGGEDLVAISLKPEIKLKEEQMVIIYGVVRPFSLVELEKDYDLGWDLSEIKEIETEYLQKPVFIAQEIKILD
jgi:hypothetical protein